MQAIYFACIFYVVDNIEHLVSVFSFIPKDDTLKVSKANNLLNLTAKS